MKLNKQFPIALALVFEIYCVNAIAQNPLTVTTDKLPASILKAFESGEYEAASVQLETYVAENPNNYNGVFLLGQSLALQGLYEESLQHFAGAKGLAEIGQISDPSIYNALGWTNFMAGNIKEAEVDLRVLTDSNKFIDSSQRAKALNNLGIIKMYTRDYDKARHYFSQAINDHQSEEAQENIELIELLEKNRMHLKYKGQYLR